MKVQLHNKSLDTLVTQALIVTVPEGKDEALPKKLGDLIPKAAHQSFTGQLDQVLTVFPAVGSIDRIVLVGLGDGKGSRSGAELFRRAVALGIKQLTAKDSADIAIYLGGLFEPTYLTDAVLMALIAPYQYRAHRSKKEDGPSGFARLALVAPEAADSRVVRRALREATIIGAAIIHARNLINTPSNFMTPSQLGTVATQVAEEDPALVATVWGEAELRKRQFGALLAVSQGSQEEAQLITLEYRPKVKSQKSASARQPSRDGSKIKTVALVGKGITFDSGGVNLKPSAHIGDMHLDMAGGAVVLATVAAAAALKLPIHVVGVIAASENMPSGSALKPGDVITSHSGLTIDVQDTDAEGRLVLADGLDHAAIFKPDYLIDIATLTGAVIVTLGEDRTAVLGNNQALIDRLTAAGEASGELVWPLPLDDDYRAYVKSDIADVTNLGKGKGRPAATIVGGAFLEKFVPKGIPWAHLDIGGTAMRSEPGPYWPKGGSGTGVRLLIELLKRLSV